MWKIVLRMEKNQHTCYNNNKTYAASNGQTEVLSIKTHFSPSPAQTEAAGENLQSCFLRGILVAFRGEMGELAKLFS
jgi:hypothetical protein